MELFRARRAGPPETSFLIMASRLPDVEAILRKALSAPNLTLDELDDMLSDSNSVASVLAKRVGIHRRQASVILAVCVSMLALCFVVLPASLTIYERLATDDALEDLEQAVWYRAYVRCARCFTWPLRKLLPRGRQHRYQRADIRTEDECAPLQQTEISGCRRRPTTSSC